MKSLRFECYAFSELSIELLYAILKLRQEVFIVEQTCYYLDADDKDQLSYHVIGFDGSNVPIAYARLVPKGVSYQDYGSIGRILTSTSYRGQGAGKELMRQSLLHYAQTINYFPIKISAQSHLLSFYQAFGFVSTREDYLEDGIPHTAMTLSHKSTI
ncbi:UNVERIFIED_CONTAM: hypothetical protein GTU68_004409 [Idotea baltica]|nr:hypothetical protein [Idotea baltica]